MPTNHLTTPMLSPTAEDFKRAFELVKSNLGETTMNGQPIGVRDFALDFSRPMMPMFPPAMPFLLTVNIEPEDVE